MQNCYCSLCMSYNDMHRELATSWPVKAFFNSGLKLESKTHLDTVHYVLILQDLNFNDHYKQLIADPS